MIRKRKTKLVNGKFTVTYQAIVHYEGEIISRKNFETKAQAVLYEQEVLKKQKLGKFGINAEYTFGMAVEDYRRTDFKLLSTPSQQARNSRFIYFAESPIANILMDKFSDQTIDDWFEWLYSHETTKNKGRKSFEQELKLLTVILHWYRENKDSTFVPPILKRHRKKCYFKPIQKRVPNYYIDVKDVGRWLNYLRDNRPNIVYYRLGLFMILTGCRLGEAAGLCWDAVTLEPNRSYVQIIRTITWDYSTKKPDIQENVKTSESFRTINLPTILVEELKKIKRVSIGGRYPVFYNLSSKSLLRDNTIRDNFNAAFKALDLPWTGSHIARHTSGTLALIAKNDITVVQAMLGHASIKQTQDYAKIIALQDNAVPHKTAELLGLS